MVVVTPAVNGSRASTSRRVLRQGICPGIDRGRSWAVWSGTIEAAAGRSEVAQGRGFSRGGQFELFPRRIFDIAISQGA